MDPSQEEDLKKRAWAMLPGFYADIIQKSQNTFLQAIYMASVPAFHKDRICLVGDAGSVAPPFTASGVFKSMENAAALAEALRTPSTLDEALTDWDKAQMVEAGRLAELGRHLENLLIWNIPDFSTMNQAEMETWLGSMANVPYARNEK
jgi:2-polyprenyl-6-methoxyphenol hydroxylase-like FAD-dependent oxidoreductase